MAVFTLTTGTPGSGKSYVRGPVFAEEFFMGGGTRLVTNLPLKVGAFIDYYNGRHPRKPIAADQIVAMDFESWQNIGDADDKDAPADFDKYNGPWKFDLREGDHIQIDEAHLACPSRGYMGQRRTWQTWMSMIRHEGMSIEFISQNWKKIDEKVLADCAKRIDLVNMEDEVNPLPGLTYGTIQQFMAKLRGQYVELVRVTERTRGTEKPWVAQGAARVIPLLPHRFALYESYSASARGVEGRQKRQWEVLGWWGFLAWVWRVNVSRLWWRFGALFAFIFLVPMGGGVWLGMGAVNHVKAVIVRGFEKSQEKKRNELDGDKGVGFGAGEADGGGNEVLETAVPSTETETAPARAALASATLRPLGVECVIGGRAYLKSGGIVQVLSVDGRFIKLAGGAVGYLGSLPGGLQPSGVGAGVSSGPGHDKSRDSSAGVASGVRARYSAEFEKGKPKEGAL